MFNRLGKSFNSDNRNMPVSKKNYHEQIRALKEKIAYYERLLAKTKKAQEIAAENEEKFHTLFQNSNDAILIMEGDHFIECNPKAELLFGMPYNELIGHTLTQLSGITLKDDPKSKRVLTNYIAAAFEGESQNFEWPLKKKDGSIVHTEISLNRMDLRGQPFLQVTIRDISQRKRTEYELQEKNLQYETLFHNSLVGMWRMEFEQPIPTSLPPEEIAKKIIFTGYISDCNEVFATMYGLPNRELMIGKKVSDLNSDLDESIRRLTKMVRNNYKMDILDNEEKDFKGNIKNFRNSFFGYIREDHLIWMWGVQLDITEQKVLEKQFMQSQKMEAIGMLAGGIAHDFNNLLTVINGYSDLIISKLPIDSPIYKNVTAIRKAGLRAANLTNQLLAFSRKQILQPKVVMINEIVEKMVQMIDRLIGDNIEVKTRLASDLGQVKVDPVKVEQIIMNLAINARDAMPNGGQLFITTSNTTIDKKYTRTHPGAQTGKYVRLEVTDTGIGIDKEILEHIFEPFFTTKDKARNTGLGLATIYGIIKQSNGYIDVISQPGEGTTFAVYFPRVDDVIDIEVDIPASKYGDQLKGEETILLVEDAENVRQVIRESLEVYGYHLLEAGDGEEALQAATLYDNPIHLVLTDVIMPRMDGYTFVKKLMPIRPEVKVLFMSGYTNESVVRDGIVEPGVQFIQKPFNLVELARRIRTLLDQK